MTDLNPSTAAGSEPATSTGSPAAQSNAGDGGAQTTGADPRADKPTPQAAPAAGAPQTTQPQAQPFAVFPTADDLNDRLERARRQGTTELLKDLGFEDPDGLKALVKAAREREDAERSDLEKLQAKLDEALRGGEGLQAERERLRAQLRQEREDRLIERMAGGLGFADVTDATQLVERTAFQYGEDGGLQTESVEAALKRLIENKPHLRGQTRTAPAIDAQAGTGKGPGAAAPAQDFSKLLPSALKRPARGAQSVRQ